MSADSSGTDSASDLSSLEPLSPSSSDSSSSSDDDMGPKAPGAGAHASAGNHKDVLHPSFQVHCDSCGALHRNPRLCDTYRTCHFCFKIHRQPDQLQVTHHVRPTGPLHITAAALSV